MSEVPRYMGSRCLARQLDCLEGSAEVVGWLNSRSRLLALHGVAGTWKVNEKEDGTSVTSLADFRVAFLERFSGQTSAVESIKLVSDQRQGSLEKVVDFHDRVRSVIMTFGKDRYQAADQEQQKASYHECLIDMIKMHFFRGLRSGK